nr:RluA family pseudouridine synthase [uncultured Blautia sp.]
MSGWSYVLTERDSGKRIGQLLKEAGFTKKQISRQKFLPSGICLDKNQCRVTDTGKAGQLLEVNFREAHSPKLASEGKDIAREIIAGETSEKEGNMEFADFSDLEILYEDEYLLAVNKPSGLACHKGRGHYTDHLGNQVVRYFLQKGRDITVRQIGRLDLDTSGIVLFALDPVTAQRLWKQRQEGQLVKTYYALVHDRLKTKTGQITLPMGKKPGCKNQMCVFPEGEGLPAETLYSLLWEKEISGEAVSCVKCHLKTGRTHQIRVHFSATGHPLLGDKIYGKEDGAKRLMLHAGELCFIHPYTRQPVKVQAQIPWETFLS